MASSEELQKNKSTGRVLLYMRAGEDVSIIRHILASMGAQGMVCTDMEDLRRRLAQEDVDAILLSETALADGSLRMLAEALQSQPDWSDLPVLFVASGGLESPQAMQVRRELPNVLILDRPVRIAALTSAVQMVLRIRDKQRQVRDLLEERQRREQALGESEARYRFLVESVNDWIWEVDRNGVYTYVGPQCQELLGYEPEEIVGKTPYDLMPPEEARHARDLFAAVIGQAKPFRHLENVNRRKDGRLVVLETNGVPILDAQGNLAGYRGVDRDITERKQAEEALRASEERLQKAISIDTVGVLFFNLDGRTIEANAAFERVAGYSREELRRMTHWETLTPPEFRAVTARAAGELASRGETAPYEKQLLRKDGSRWWGLFAPTRLAGSGRDSECVEFIIDITDRKQAEEALRESEQRLALAASGTRIGMYDRDVATGQTVGTEQVARLLGLRTTTTLSQLYHYDEWVERVHPEDRAHVEAELRRCLAEHVPYEAEYRVIRPDGSVHWVADRGVFRYDSDGQATRLLGILMGITERKRREEALRESEERLHRAMESGKVGVWEWEVGTDNVQWSQGVYPLLGCKPEEVTPSLRAIRERIDPRDLARHDEALKDSLERCEDYLGEFRVVWADGSVHWLAARGQYVYVDNPNGTVLRLRGVFADIDARKQAEEALRRSEEQFHRLFEDDLTGNSISTPEGQILLCNPAFAAIFGFSRAADAVGTNIVDLYLDSREWLPLIERLKREGKIERLELWRKRRDGESIHLVENLVGHFNEQGELDEIKAYLFEDTERKRAEEALRESEQRLRSHMENSPLGVVEWDKDLVVTRWAGEAEKILGWSAAETVGKPIGELNVVYPDDLPLVARTIQRLTDGVSRHVVSANRNVTRTGAVRHCVWYNSVLLDANGKMSSVLSLVQDITEQKRAEESLQELNATLESKVAQRTAELKHRTNQLQKLALEMSKAEDRERERIAQILHDDLQQELAAVKFHLSVVRSRIKDDPSVQEITGRVDEMLKDAIGKSRGLSHELSPAVLRQGDFAEILRWLAKEMQTRHGLAVHVRGRARVPSDPIKAFLYRTAQELLFNTVKHAQVAEARVQVRQSGGYLCLLVSDRGRGFDPERLREAAGFGLLSIRERIELLGGRMKIRSAADRGSTFLVVVPESEEVVGSRTSVAGEEREEDSADYRLPITGYRRSLRVLLADDHQVVRQGLAALLGEEEAIAIVGEATNGREAVDLAEQLHPDVVIMDVLMPVMSGEEATRQIKRDLPQTRIVALSMREEAETRERMDQAGANGYVLKTAPYKELLAAIRGKESDA